MQTRDLDDGLTVSGQIGSDDMPALAAQGVRHVICNRPDGEGSDQPAFAEIKRAAEAVGIEAHYLPVTAGNVRDEEAAEFGRLLAAVTGPVHAYCRTGMRSTTLWALSRNASGPGLAEIVRRAHEAGYGDMSGVAARIAGTGVKDGGMVLAEYDVVVVGGSAGGIAVASSLLARDRNLSVAIVDPADIHYYQPGWTFVGAGIFKPAQTAKTMASLIPKGVDWVQGRSGCV